jgi:hypothetical protein
MSVEFGGRSFTYGAIGLLLRAGGGPSDASGV